MRFRIYITWYVVLLKRKEKDRSNIIPSKGLWPSAVSREHLSSGEEKMSAEAEMLKNSCSNTGLTFGTMMECDFGAIDPEAIKLAENFPQPSVCPDPTTQPQNLERPLPPADRGFMAWRFLMVIFLIDGIFWSTSSSRRVFFERQTTAYGTPSTFLVSYANTEFVSASHIFFQRHQCALV